MSPQLCASSLLISQPIAIQEFVEFNSTGSGIAELLQQIAATGLRPLEPAL
ncbi:hypothetical protein [Agrobacterium rosae]|uniref:hypothetical protein n=1 Tax=Agrobacterium rosae TaxID=1972867 RepID=UPI003BA18F7F